MKIVIVGSTGFLGSAIRAGLAEGGEHTIVPFSRAERSGSGGAGRCLDLLSPPAVAEALAEVRPDVVINAAGRVPGTPAELYRDNAALTATLAEAIVAASPATRLVQLGSAAEYGRSPGGAPFREEDRCSPAGLYGFSKQVAADHLFHLARTRGLRLNHLRVFNPLGAINSPHQIVGAFLARARAAAAPKTVEMGRLDAVRDFVAVHDLVTLVRRLVAADLSQVVVNVCSGQGRSVREVIALLAAQSGEPIRVVERGPEPPPGTLDTAVGDPTRFLELSGLAAPTPVDAVLASAWQQAMAQPDGLP
ncbi:MAG: NAD-dependent epimerase/dehydratase [Enterovirga sp.]|nr:NAD-dependent epimerase/dehydratase [Enterovirga sp.]